MQKLLLLFLLAGILISCETKESKELNNEDSTYVHHPKKIADSYILLGTKYLYAQNDTLKIKARNKNIANATISINNDTLKSSVLNDSIVYAYLSTNIRVGRQRVKISSNDSLKEEYKNITITTINSPVKKKFKVHRTLKHNIADYTQGLLYEGGVLYESTGMRGKSIMRKSTFSTGALLKEVALPSDYFGEGIAVMGDTIVQLTWQSNTGFIYNKSTFNKIREFNYSTEGWGITTIGNQFVMSDGSEYLHFIETKNFTVEYSIQAYDNYGPVKQLNELEYVDGFIYANVYQQNFIVKINAKTGAVEERLYVDVLKPEDRHRDIDVLNGIAFVEGKFLITGKNWPKMFVGDFVGF